MTPRSRSDRGLTVFVLGGRWTKSVDINLIQPMGCIHLRSPLVFNSMVEYKTSAVGVEDRSLNAVFSALADPTRRAIVDRLASGEATVGELAQPFTMSLQAVSKHLQVLEQAGLVDRSRRAQQRPCRLRPEALAYASGWLGDYRQLWETSFDRLNEHLAYQKGPST
jgi:DNA-binding transcriptional ArsR family regulator